MSGLPQSCPFTRLRMPALGTGLHVHCTRGCVDACAWEGAGKTAVQETAEKVEIIAKKLDEA